MDIEIQTYWNVETLYYVFNAVTAMMAGAGFSGLLKLVFLFAIAIGMFGYMNKQLEMAKWFIHALVFVTILNLPIARVALVDKTGLEPPRVVEHVPFALAVTAQTTNLVFGSLTSAYETAFGVPDDLGLQKGDVGFGHRILKQVNNATVRDPELRSDLMQFIKECTLYDVKDEAIKAKEIIGGVDTWNVIFNNTSPARFVTYDTLTSNPKTDNCVNVAAILKEKVNQAVIAGQTFYGKQAFTRAGSDAIATSMFVSTVGTSYDWILNNSSNASDAMKQSMFNNIWKEAGTELPALLNDPARVAEVSALAGAAQAARQADGSNSTLSLLAQETLPHMRNWIEAIIYAMFPVIVVLMVVSSTEAAKKILSGYLMSLAWIGLWPLLFAVINHLSLMHLRYKARSLELASGVPFQMTDVFDATLSNEQAAIGYMVVLVPFIAGAIIKMGQGGFMGVADRMMTGFSSAGAAVGSSGASGNYSMGQAGLDTASVNTTSMHKYDSNMSLQGGGSMVGLANGGTMTTAANGTVAMAQLQNRLLKQMNVDHRLEAGLNDEAHRTQIVSKGDQLGSRHAEGTVLSDVKGREDTRGRHQSDGVVVANSVEGGKGGQYVVGQSLDRNINESSSLKQSVGVNDQLHMNLGLQRPGGAVGGAVGGGGKPDPREEKRIDDALMKGGATKQERVRARDEYRASFKGGEAPGGIVGAGLGYAGTRLYSTDHTRDRNVGTRHGAEEGVKQERNYAIRGSRANQREDGVQAAQNNRHSIDASRTKADENFRVKDTSSRLENGVGSRVNRSESNSFTVHEDLMASPQFLQAVAARNGMSQSRFANQSDSQVMEMIQNYVSEMQVAQKSTTMPTQNFAGDKLPTTAPELKKIEEDNKKGIPQNINSIHAGNVASTGYAGAAPLKVDTSTPEIVGSSTAAVDAQLDPKNKGSIPSRAAKLDENVTAFASPDKEIGAGRANPAAMNEESMKRDVVDSFDKLVDKVTGGDGMADGEKLNDNMKRTTAAQVPINDRIK